jgi:DNA replication and repair protein RecF
VNTGTRNHFYKCPFSQLLFYNTVKKPNFAHLMPHLDQIEAIQFKNYEKAHFAFPERITGICGPNGSGKTNLLDAIYYLCFTKSYFAGTDAQLVNIGKNGFRISGVFSLNGDVKATVTAILRENGKKEIQWNGEIYPKVSAHIGKLPLVVVAPDDIELITGASETRRKMADAMLCQLDSNYLRDLMDYNKILQQRNSLLKQMAENPGIQAGVLDILDEQLVSKGSAIFRKRSEELVPFLQKAADHYTRIAGKPDAIRLSYQSQLNTTDPGQTSGLYSRLLKQSLQKDKALQRTTIGIHRDDLYFEMMEQPFKQKASQGQRKSLLFALKLTEFEWLEKAKGFAPVLLLDDVFEKLDDERMQNLLREVCLEKNGQVFITDTHRDRLESSLIDLKTDYSIISL